MSCLGIIGLFLLWRQALIRPALLLAAIFASFPLIYYLAPAFPRYRYPMDWTMWLLAGFTVITAWNRIRREGRQP